MEGMKGLVNLQFLLLSCLQLPMIVGGEGGEGEG